MTILQVLQGDSFSLITTLETLVYEILVAGVIGWFFGQMTLRILNGKHDRC
jgi:CPA1 family monovalent cation:H+ antiporter